MQNSKERVELWKQSDTWTVEGRVRRWSGTSHHTKREGETWYWTLILEDDVVHR